MRQCSANGTQREVLLLRPGVCSAPWCANQGRGTGGLLGVCSKATSRERETCVLCLKMLFAKLCTLPENKRSRCFAWHPVSVQVPRQDEEGGADMTSAPAKQLRGVVRDLAVIRGEYMVLQGRTGRFLFDKYLLSSLWLETATLEDMQQIHHPAMSVICYLAEFDAKRRKRPSLSPHHANSCCLLAHVPSSGHAPSSARAGAACACTGGGRAGRLMHRPSMSLMQSAGQLMHMTMHKHAVTVLLCMQAVNRHMHCMVQHAPRRQHEI